MCFGSISEHKYQSISQEGTHCLVHCGSASASDSSSLSPCLPVSSRDFTRQDLSQQITLIQAKSSIYSLPLLHLPFRLPSLSVTHSPPCLHSKAGPGIKNEFPNWCWQTMHWLLNWYKQHLFNSCVTAAGEEKKEKQSLCRFINHCVNAAHGFVQRRDH